MKKKSWLILDESERGLPNSLWSVIFIFVLQQMEKRNTQNEDVSISGEACGTIEAVYTTKHLWT